MAFSDLSPGARKEEVRRVLTRLVAELKPGEVVPTTEMGNRVATLLGDANGQALANIINRLVDEGRFPECRRTGETFVAYGRVNYRRAWYGSPGEGQPIPSPKPKARPADKLATLSQRVAALEEQMARILAGEPQPPEPVACINCGFPGTGYEDGLCPDCITDLCGPQEKDHV